MFYWVIFVILQNFGEIFIILRDEVIGDIVEIEFILSIKCVRIWLVFWIKIVWYMKVLGKKFFCVLINIKYYFEFFLINV